eukprot:gnl/MRDRNA2_/MRDRNA2_116128_c0_seq1.p1 gnl/MRDRNA2_/MRDRNA2_116128_c0~~gnl/MRDRNA2_/MRDRNA2_116128_c0_seq1.p1  ORF type:complete len:438 (-),score=98.99 gnl/MRDRNA2_/MRDRNA2_116128_c0_seq1:73-1386(-)
MFNPFASAEPLVCSNSQSSHNKNAEKVESNQFSSDSDVDASLQEDNDDPFGLNSLSKDSEILAAPSAGKQPGGQKRTASQAFGTSDDEEKQTKVELKEDSDDPREAQLQELDAMTDSGENQEPEEEFWEVQEAELEEPEVAISSADHVESSAGGMSEQAKLCIQRLLGNDCDSTMLSNNSAELSMSRSSSSRQPSQESSTLPPGLDEDPESDPALLAGSSGMACSSADVAQEYYVRFCNMAKQGKQSTSSQKILSQPRKRTRTVHDHSLPRKDEGKAAKAMTPQALVDLSARISYSRLHRYGENSPRTVRHAPEDPETFEWIAHQVISSVSSFSGPQLCAVATNFARIGIANKALFEAMAPRILARQKQIGERIMGNAIKAYRKFAFPLAPEKQGWRTIAKVCKGDFQRPSDKPKAAKQTFDKPVPLLRVWGAGGRG